MSLPRKSLLAFLNSAKSALNSAIQRSTPITFVVGNESADLDSLCSAIVLAYLRTYAGSSAVQVPLSNLSRADLSLRPELRPVLSRANINPSDLITLSDLPPVAKQASVLDPQRTRWILVDHNALQGELGKVYSDRVVGTIDHHDEENQVPKDCGEPRVVTQCGSCASLVIEYCKEAWDGLSTKPSTEETIAAWDAELAHLALAPILIDTANLKSSKVTPADTRAVEYLEAKLSASSAEYSRGGYFEQVSAAKEDIGGLSLTDIFRKDYKQWAAASGSVNFGISAVVKELGFLLQKAASTEALLGSIREFAAGRELSLYAIMTTSLAGSGTFKRELLLCTLDDIGAEAARAFEDNAVEILGLKLWGDGELHRQGGGGGGGHQPGWICRGWVQERIEKSRKQVGPLLRKAVDDTTNRIQS